MTLILENVNDFKLWSQLLLQMKTLVPWFQNVDIPKVVILMYIIPIEVKTATKVEIIAQTKLTLAQIVLNSAITRFTTKL